MRPGRTAFGLEIVEQLAEFGYDYIELSLAHMMALSEAEFGALAQTRADLRHPLRSLQQLLPPHRPPDGRCRGLAAGAGVPRRGRLPRAAELGAQTIVFGSSGAKNVPEGFPVARALGADRRDAAHGQTIAAEHGIAIAIEPLNRRESNIVLAATEGLALSRQVRIGLTSSCWWITTT